MRLAILGDGLLARSIFDVLLQVSPNEDEVLPIGHDRFDITSLDSLVAILEPIKPDVIVNTVARHSLLDCEQEPMMARLVNEIGAGRVAGLAPTIYVSTDYVFNDDGPHDEVMPGERPRSVYGQTKLGGELATLEHGGIVVRVSGLYHERHKSHKGPSFPDLVTSSFDPLKVPTDQRFSPTYAVDAAQRIVELAAGLAARSSFMQKPEPVSYNEAQRRLQPAGIYHAANAGSTSWYEFATHIAEVTRHKRTITGFAAHDKLRPGNSSLRSTRLPPLRHWMHGLQAWAVERDKYLYSQRVSPLRANP